VGRAHERAQSRRAKRTVGRSRNSRCQTAQCSSFPQRVVAPGFCLLLVASASPRLCRPPAFATLRRTSEPAFSLRDDGLPHPRRGVDGAPTDALFLSVAPATRDHPVPGRPGPLSALHRGDFRMRTHEVGSRQWDRSRSDCPRQAVTAWRSGSGPPVVAVRAAAWDATPRSAFQDRLRKTPLHERGWESLYYKFVT
jgi:hypothetical protein